MSDTSVSGARVLVVGGAGFVGSNLVSRLLVEEAAKILVVDNLLSAELENVPDDSRVRVIDQSITAPGVIDEVGLDWDLAFHLATYHGNQSSIANPHADLENNLRPTLVIAEHLKDSTSLKSLVYASAGCTVAEKTYGEAKPTSEEDSVSLYLDSPYQISKIVGEFYLNYFERSAGLPSVKARFQNVYGPREVLGAGEWRGTPATVWRNVVPTFIFRALSGQELLLENEGKNSRDFIYVDDLVEGLIQCALKGKTGGVYNLASGVESTIRELAETIIRVSGSNSDLKLLPARSWDRSGRRFGSTEKSESELGFLATTSLEEGIQRTIDWTNRNIEMIDRTIEKHRHRLE